MKIVYHCGHPYLNYSADTGYGRHMRGVVKGYEESGHQVVLDIAGGTKSGFKEEKIEKKKTSRGKKALKRLIPSLLWETIKDLKMLWHNRRLYYSLKKKVEQEKPDIIHERISYLHDAGLRVARELNVPLVLEVNTPMREAKTIFEGTSLLIGKAEKMERRLFKGSDLVLLVSSALKDYFKKKYWMQKKNLLVVPNAVDQYEIGGFATNDRERIRAKLGIKEVNQLVGFVGSIFPYHGLDMLLSSYSIIKKDYPSTCLLIVGDGESLPDLKERVRQEGIKDVFFTGKVPNSEVGFYIASMDVAVMPASNWFGSPVKIFEYGAKGVPVVVPNTKPVNDVVEDGRTGHIHDMTEEGLRNAIQKHLDNPEKSLQMGKAFQEKVSREHTWKKNVRRFLEFLERV